MSRIVVLTGAGISAESGLGTFRGPGGLWERHDVTELATPEAFARDPALVHRFYNARRAAAAAAEPNAAHRALVRLADAWPGEVAVITQNVDALHERAGQTGVIHVHGELACALCGACGARWDAPAEMSPRTPCPACGAAAARPDVVWFGEVPYQLDDCAALVERADLFAAIGTSGQVWPVAGFAEMAAGAGARTVELTLEPGPASRRFDEHRHGPATATVPDWVDRVLSDGV